MKKKIIKIIQIILIAVIIYSLYYIGTYYYAKYKAGKEFDEYKNIVSTTKAYGDEDEAPLDKDKKEVEKEDVDYLKLEEEDSFKKHQNDYNKIAIESLQKFKQMNQDIVSYINIPELDISYPVVHRDNDYYLLRNLQGEHSIAGTVFIEELNKPDLSDMNTVIYGHNMSWTAIKTAKMFQPILKYGEQDFVDSSDAHYIEMYTEKGVNRYRVFSAYYTNAYYDYRTLNKPKEEWTAYLDSMVEDSITDFGYTNYDENSKMITLSTCDNVNVDGRFTVHAILVED